MQLNFSKMSFIGLENNLLLYDITYIILKFNFLIIW